MNEQYNRLAIDAAGVTIEELNSILEFQINSNHEIIVKQCSHMTMDNQNTNGYRHGRFNLDEEEHHYLRGHEGLYLFIVHHGILFSEMRFMKAVDLGYSKLIAWPTIWSWTEPENIPHGIFTWLEKTSMFFDAEEDHKHGL